MNRIQAAWAVSYVYLAYLFLGDVPGLSDLAIFSLQLASALLVPLFVFSSWINWGLATTGRYLVVTWLVSYGIEFIGVNTGVPFGNYSYTPALSPLIGPVPLYIPFLWCALGYFSLQASGASIVAPAALMTLLDVSFDPVFSRSLWQWRDTIGPQYFGVPVLNFLGWFLTAILIFVLFWVTYRRTSQGPRRGIFLSGGSREAVGFYFLFGISNVIYEVNSGIPVAAVVSAALFGIAAILLWRLRVNRKNGML